MRSNRKRIVIGVLVGLVYAAGLPAQAAPVQQLIGGTPDGVLYDIDPATGVASNPRSTGIADLVGLAFSPDGVLYGRTGFSVSPFRRFYRIDGRSGNSEVLGLIPYGLDFEFDPGTSLLYSVSPGAPGASHNLYTFDPLTFDFQNVGEVGASFGSVAVDTIGQVYVLGKAMGSSQGVLLQVDKTTGATIRSWPIAMEFGQVGTAFGLDGNLYVAEKGPTATGQLQRFDFGSGMLVAIGPTGVNGGITSLAFVPEPITLSLVVAGIAILVAGTRRSRRSLRAALVGTLVAAGWCENP